MSCCRGIFINFESDRLRDLTALSTALSCKHGNLFGKLFYMQMDAGLLLDSSEALGFHWM